MKKAIIPILVLGFVLSLSFSPALAMQIETMAEYRTLTGTDYDSDSGASGTVQSSIFHSVPPSGYYDATAVGDDSGNIAASAGVLLDNGTGGPTLENYAYAMVTSAETYTVENDGYYSWNFNVGTGQLLVLDNVDAPPGMGAGYEMGIYVDDTPEWVSAFALYGGGGEFEMRPFGESLGGTYFEADVDGGQLLGYNFDPYSGSLDLGFLSAGTTFSISQVLAVGATAADYGVGAAAYFGDTLDLANAGISGELVASNVPVPAALLLFGSGLAGLIIVRRNNLVRQ